MATVNELAALYVKVQNGTATECERFQYRIGIDTSCIDKQTLLNMVQAAAKRIDK